MEKKLTAEDALIDKFIESYGAYVFENALSDNCKLGDEYRVWLAGKLSPVLKGYASQECSSKDEEIQKLKEEIKDLEERFDGVAETNVSAHEYAKKLSEQLESKDERIKELEECVMMLKRYGMIHPVTGVVYPEGSHEHFIDKAEKLLTPDTDTLIKN